MFFSVICSFKFRSAFDYGQPSRQLLRSSCIRPCFVVVNLSVEDVADFEVLRDVAMVTNFRTKFAVTGFV